MAWYRTVLLALQQAFLALREEGGGYLDQGTEEWADLKVTRWVVMVTWPAESVEAGDC